MRKLSKEHSIPLSTLKLNAKILLELELISFGQVGKGKPATVTEFGSHVLKIMEGYMKGGSVPCGS